ncbi:major facilitator superfamily [Ceratocystis lukuohia]|uniref:Major facilitator superfamily n=1 Tax=Ceratocystis lukuohia TaxID=2019550 RepID=A0ABR4MH76_9PEZI
MSTAAATADGGAGAAKPGAVQSVPADSDVHCAASDCEKQLQPSHAASRAGDAPVYSVFTRSEKWALTTITIMAGLHSPFPANIYLPAIPSMATIFQKSIGEMNLTVTTYLVFQGCAPMFWGPLSDRYGRRPIFLSCLSVLVGACIGLALCPTNAFWLLLLLRCMQAAGCASTVALSAGVIGDIATPEERGGFYGISNIGPMIAPAMAPAIGGVLSQNLGWRSVFWFLVISGSLCILLIALFYPETARNIAGNGSPSVSLVYRAFIPIIGRGRLGTAPALSKAIRIPYTNPFTIFLCPDVCVMLLSAGIIYATWYTVTATISSSFKEIYDLSEAEIGLWYIPVGSEMAVSSVITGKIQDWDYRRVKARTPPGTPLPKELARLRFTPIYVCGFMAAICSWGFCLEYKAPKAVLGVVSFFTGYGMVCVLNNISTLMIDIMHTRSSAATACLTFDSPLQINLCYVSTALGLD